MSFDLNKYKFRVEDTLLLAIDLQEKLVSAIHDADKFANTNVRLIEGAKALGLPIINTLQYPKGLGRNIKQIDDALPEDVIMVEKTNFSAYEDIAEILKKQGRKNILVVGTETHVCVLQTVNELLMAGYNVIVVSDCCGSRTQANIDNGLSMMLQMGAVVMNYESILFILLHTAKNPKFKDVSNIVK